MLEWVKNKPLSSAHAKNQKNIDRERNMNNTAHLRQELRKSDLFIFECGGLASLEMLKNS